MTQQTGKREDGKCLVGNWFEERAAAAAASRVTPVAPMERRSETQEAYGSRNILGVKVKGMRGELLEIPQKTIEEVEDVGLNPPEPKAEFCSITQKDFCVPGFTPSRPQPTKGHDYKTEQAVTFWSENHLKIQGVTPVQTPETPFKKSTLFSTPVSERLDEA